MTRHLFILALLAVCMARGDVRPPSRDMDLYLLIGQSNMAGRGVLTETNRVGTVLRKLPVVKVRYFFPVNNDFALCRNVHTSQHIQHS